MTKKNTLKALAFLGALAAAGNLQAAELSNPASPSLEACINGEVSASGRFPTQAMEDQFNAYTNWVNANGLTVEHAFAPEVPAIRSLDAGWNAKVSASGRFPTQAMEDQFNAYTSWVQTSGLGATYALNTLTN
jgi:hypothetical protein